MSIAIVAAVSAVVILVVFVELAAAVLPMLIVLAAVPPEERQDLAELIAACDSSRKLRLWPALRVAVEARRRRVSIPEPAVGWSDQRPRHRVAWSEHGSVLSGRSPDSPRRSPPDTTPRPAPDPAPARPGQHYPPARHALPHPDAPTR